MDQKLTSSTLDHASDLFIFCGESSGDSIGAELIQALLSLDASLKISSVAGPKMRSYPIHTFIPMEEFQVMGFVDVLKSLPKLIKLFKTIKHHLLKYPPKAVVLIDYPGFNLRMASHLRKAGFQGAIIQYVCPSVWAWKKKRIQQMTHSLDLLLCIFPFEKACFAHTSLPVDYVGHPLASHHPHQEENSLLLKEVNTPILSIFPGSRRKELERNFPLQLKAAAELSPDHYTLAVSCSQDAFKAFIEHERKKYPHKSIVLFSSQNNYTIMKKSTLALATSGTITLELALHGVPTLVTYGMSRFDIFLATHLFRIRLPHYCIANYIINQRMFPELYGPDFTYETLSKTLALWLKDTSILSMCKQQCDLVKTALYQEHPSLQAAQSILKYRSY
jgi:lipid-A-disaccharide synthase